MDIATKEIDQQLIFWKNRMKYYERRKVEFYDYPPLWILYDRDISTCELRISELELMKNQIEGKIYGKA